MTVRFSQLVSQLQQVSIATERLFEIFDEKPEVVNDPDPVFLNNIKGQVTCSTFNSTTRKEKNVINTSPYTSSRKPSR